MFNYSTNICLLLLLIMIKFLAIYHTNFDLFGDEAQYWIWSQKPDLGYYSKPPLLPWFIGLVTFVFGNSFVAIKLIPFIFYFFTSFVVFLISLKLFNKKDLAVWTAVSFYLMPSVTISSFLLSTDIVLLFFWSLSLLFFLKLRESPKFINFILLGIFIGLSFLAKYAAIYFLLSLLILIFFDQKTRRVFKENILNSFVFLLSILVVLLPNILWNSKNGWLTLIHTSDNAALNRIDFNFFQSFEFLIVQILMLGPLLMLIFIFLIKKINLKFQNIFLLTFSLPIFLIVWVESFLVRANANWAAVAHVAIFIFVFNVVFNYSKKILKINNVINYVFCIIFFGLILTSYPLKVFDRINGIASFANYLEKNYLKEYNHLVIEDRLLYSNMRYELRNTDNKILMSYNPNHSIKSHFHISTPLTPNFKNAFVYVGEIEGLDYIKNKINVKKKESLGVLFQKKDIEIYEIYF